MRSGKSEGNHPSGILGREASRGRTLCLDPYDPGLSLREGESGGRGHCQRLSLLAQWPSPNPGPVPRDCSLQAGWGWLFGQSTVLLIRKYGGEATQRDGVSSGGGFVTPSFPLIVSRTHLPTLYSGRRALESFILDGGGAAEKAKPPPLALPLQFFR